jgi:hypothetical protein
MKAFLRKSIERLVAVGEECRRDDKKLGEVLWCTDSDAITVRGLLSLKRIPPDGRLTPTVRRSVQSLVEIGKACKRCGWKRGEACFGIGTWRKDNLVFSITIGDLLNLRHLQPKKVRR